MKPTFARAVITMGASLCIVLWQTAAQAAERLPTISLGSPYVAAKQHLIAQGWQPVPNREIAQSSLYAQSLAEEGLTEVVDCISMALDGCEFHFAKGRQTLAVHTITRQLSVEKIALLKKSK